MTFSFDNTLPTARDRVRYALGDTDAAAALEQNETITANLTLYGEDLAIAEMAEALAARFARKPDSLGEGELSLTWRERVKTWLALAAARRAKVAAAASAVAAAAAGSASVRMVRRGDEVKASEYVREWWTG